LTNPFLPYILFLVISIFKKMKHTVDICAKLVLFVCALTLIIILIRVFSSPLFEERPKTYHQKNTADFLAKEGIWRIRE
jgi:hypothetical protein